MFVYLVMVNEESPQLFGVFFDEKMAIKEKNILKSANDDVKIVSLECSFVPEYVYTVDYLYDEAGFSFQEVLTYKFSEKKAKGIYTHLYKSGQYSLDFLRVKKHKIY